MASSLSAPPSATTYPNSFSCVGSDFHSVAAGAATRYYVGGVLISICTNTQNTKIRWSKIRLAAGTYTLRVVAAKGVNMSYIKVDIDSQVGVMNTDYYNAGDVVVETVTTGITLAEGEHTIDIYNPTKNASAGEYSWNIKYIQLFRTA